MGNLESIPKNWIIRLIPESSEGYCWNELKTIDLGLKSSNPLRLLLHEIAHIGNNKTKNKHNKKWFNDYLGLMKKYLPGVKLSKSDKILQRTYNLYQRTISI